MKLSNYIFVVILSNRQDGHESVCPVFILCDRKSVYAKNIHAFSYYKLFEIIFAAIKYRHVEIFAAFIE